MGKGGGRERGFLKKPSTNPPTNIKKQFQNHQQIYQKPLNNQPKITQNQSKSIKSAPRDPQEEKLDLLMGKICEMKAN